MVPLTSGLPRRARAAACRLILTPVRATVPVVGGRWPDSPLWAYNGTVRGPEIRARQGETIRVAGANGHAEPTTVHWHGMREPNATGGVPGVTQAPIAPGENFTYEFKCAFKAVDAGTFWCHSHMNSSERQGGGLAGHPIVEEAETIMVDRDVTWASDDWLLLATAEIAFAADAPGDWLFRCHILEHLAA